MNKKRKYNIYSYIDFIKESTENDIKRLINEFDGTPINLWQKLNSHIRFFDSIDDLYNDGEFNGLLNDNDLRKEDIQYSTDINKLKYNFDFNFFVILNKKDNDLENPLYIVMEFNNKINYYKINNNIENFYSELSNTKITINDGNNIIYYMTDDGGNTWFNTKNKENIISKERMLSKTKKYNNVHFS